MLALSEVVCSIPSIELESLISSFTASTARSSTESLEMSVETSSAALAAPMRQHRRTKNIARYFNLIFNPPLPCYSLLFIKREI